MYVWLMSQAGRYTEFISDQRTYHNAPAIFSPCSPTIKIRGQALLSHILCLLAIIQGIIYGRCAFSLTLKINGVDRNLNSCSSSFAVKKPQTPAGAFLQNHLLDS